mgnify:CR=1 FL=1
MAVKQIGTDDFETEVLQAERPVVVDFWAGWCGPCQMVGPLIEQLSEEIPEIKFTKVNVDDELELARQYKVESIPTLIVFKAGKEVKRQVGALPKAAIRQFIEN